MLKLCATLLTLLFTVHAAANTYRGTITQTVTETDNPLYQVGQMLTGWYEYESDTMDGTFTESTSWSCVNPDAVHSLSGAIAACCPYGNGMIDLSRSMDRFWTQLTVTGGEVSFFYMYGSWGAVDYDFWTDHFLSRDNGLGHLRYTTRGSLAFSGPQLLQAGMQQTALVGSVPESGSTLLLIGLSLASALTVRSRFRRA